MRFHGLIAAPHTPFTTDGRLNLGVIPRQVENLVSNDIRGAFVCGTTGECTSLTLSERFSIAEEWQRHSHHRLPILVHVGHTCLAEARELAKHAAELGAAAIAAVAPYYFKPGVDDLADFLAAIAAAAPNVPFYFYDIPSFTGVRVPTVRVMELLAARCPNFAGVKFSNPDLVTLQECLALYDGRFDMLFGIDEMLLAAVALGIRGAVGSTYNYAAPIYHRMFEAVSRGDFESARECQLQSARMVRILEKFGGLAAGKEAMKLHGIDCGPVRSPLRKLIHEESTDLLTELAKIVDNR